MWSNDNYFTFDGNENTFFKIFGLDLASINNGNSIENIMQQDNTDYKYKINELKLKIEMCLVSGNKDLFMKLSKQYNMMLAEL